MKKRENLFFIPRRAHFLPERHRQDRQKSSNGTHARAVVPSSETLTLTEVNVSLGNSTIKSETETQPGRKTSMNVSYDTGPYQRKHSSSSSQSSRVKKSPGELSFLKEKTTTERDRTTIAKNDRERNRSARGSSPRTTEELRSILIATSRNDVRVLTQTLIEGGKKPQSLILPGSSTGTGTEIRSPYGRGKTR